MSAITVNFQDSITPRLAALFAGLGDDRRAELNESMGLPVSELTRHYLDELAATRHDTAAKLGATPSGFFAQAAEKVNLSTNAAAATVSIDQPGMGRAEHAVDITAAAGKSLTIPLIAAAYNQRAYAVQGLFPVMADDKPFLAMKGADGGLVFWYELVPSVHQEQDRTLLPGDEEIAQAAKEGALEFVDALLSEAAGGTPA